MKIAIIGAAAAIAGFAAATITTPATAATITVELGLDELNTIVASTVSRVQIRINNLGPLKRGSFHKRNSSYARFPGAAIRAFDIPPAIIKKSRRTTTAYYISDMRSDFVGVSFTDQTIQLSASFELSGDELVAKCVRGRGRRARECSPFPYTNVNLDQAVVSANLTPVVYKNSVSFRASDLSLKGNVQISYCDFFLTSWLCTTVVDVPRIVERKRAAIQKALLSKLNGTRFRDAVAKAVLKQVETRLASSGTLGSLRVKRIRLGNDKLLITANVKLALTRR